MVDSVGSSSSSLLNGATSASSSSLSASYDMFLQLLVTQLQTQNPLDPADATEFTQQLATYAGLEQQIATNDKLDSVLGNFDSLSFSTGVGYLGRNVEADTDTLTMGDDGTVDATWKYSLGATADKVKLEVLDSDGNVVWSGTGETASGDHSFTWDGKDSKGNAVAAGDYTLKVTATDADNADIDATIHIRGAVTAVDSSDGSTVLELGDTRIGLGSIVRLAA
ncbi:MAG: flagellar hook assembly protein FlgD [Magnetospirillum sp.]|nr:flagellar hook assembly protein FlgD [Magnetospirillum sp.]